MFRLILLICLLGSKFAYGNQYRHYSWSEVFEKTHLALKVKVIKANDIYAKVQVLDCYNTTFNASEIWVRSTGIHSAENNEHFIIFISDTIKKTNSGVWSDEDQKAWAKLETPEIKKAIENNQAYYAIGLSGQYPITADKIAIDLSNPHAHKNNTLYPLIEVETMLRAVYNPAKNVHNFHAEIIDHMGTLQEPSAIVHYLKMLSMSRIQSWDNVFEKISAIKNNEVQLALIESLIKMEGDVAELLLLEYWRQNDPSYSEKIITELVANKNTAFAPYLLHTLDSIITISNDLNTAEKPTQYHEIQGLLYYFKNVEYPAAIPQLQKLLVCSNTNLIERAMIGLELNGDSTYAGILKTRIENEAMTNQLVCTLSIYAKKFQLKPIYDPLIVRCFSNDADQFSAIAAGVLLQLNPELGIPLLAEQFNRMIIDHSHLASYRYGQVFQKYVGLCYNHTVPGAMEMIYKGFSEYAGYGYSFRENPALFTRVNELQDSLKNVIKKQLNTVNYDHFETFVRLNETDNFDYYISITYSDYSKKMPEDSLVEYLKAQRIICSNYLNLPISRIQTKTAKDNYSYYEDEYYYAVLKSENRVISSFYGYLITFGNEKDLQFLTKLAETESESAGYSLDWTLDEAIEDLKTELKNK